MNQQAFTGDSDGITWVEFERMVMSWLKTRYGMNYAQGLWNNILRDISWLDLEIEDDFDIFKIECNKVFEIMMNENERYAMVMYSKGVFWTKRWQEDYRRDQRQKLYEYLMKITRGEPLRRLIAIGERWMKAVGGPRAGLFHQFGGIDPAVLKDRVQNYCRGMPGVDMVTPWEHDVNLREKLYKMEREYKYLRNLPASVTKNYKGYDKVTSEEKLVEIIIDCAPSWCKKAVDLARNFTIFSTKPRICGQSVAVHRQKGPKRRHEDKSVRLPSYRHLKRELERQYARRQLKGMVPNHQWSYQTPPTKSSQRHAVKFGRNADFAESHDEVMENVGSDEREHESGHWCKSS